MIPFGNHLILLLLLCCTYSILFTFRAHVNIIGYDLGFGSSSDTIVSIGDFTDDSYTKHIKNYHYSNESKNDDDDIDELSDDDSAAHTYATENEGEDGGQANGNVNKDPPKDRHRMNVLFLYPDDWRHDSLGSENPILQTPFLDTLAQEGIRFRQNAVTTSICWQSRATLFSGQWASRHRSFTLKCPHFAKGENWNHTWAEMLRNDGYHTGHVGKWQYYNVDVKERFDYYHGFEGRHWYKFNKQKWSGDDLARYSAVDFLQKRPKDKPFSLSVAFYPPKPVGSSREPVSISSNLNLI